jgi:hypothetical protein
MVQATTKNRKNIDVADFLESLANDMEGNGLAAFSKAAYYQVKAAMSLKVLNDPRSKDSFAKAANLSEKGQNFTVAVLIYLEIGDTQNVKRLAPMALTEIGDDGALGKSLKEFSTLRDGSAYEDVAISKLNESASTFMMLAGDIPNLLVNGTNNPASLKRK